MAQKDGVSQPDNTNADNPSETGTPTVNSQDGTPTPETHTYTYGAMDKSDKRKDVDATSADGVNSIHDAAVKSVIDRTSEQYRQNPNFDKDVKAAEDEIRKNAEATKDM